MNKIKAIKNDQDYNEALALLGELMTLDPKPESTEGEQLDILSALIQEYELKNFPSDLPSPVEAIKFRMEQSDLQPADLIPYIGSKSRVSEILSGKRQLTLEMVRALETGLGIPAKVLIKKPDDGAGSDYQNWDQKLVREMSGRGYFGNISFKLQDQVELLKNFFAPIASPAQMVGMLRQSSSYRASPLTDRRALAAWSACVIKKAKNINTLKPYQAGSIDLDFMRELVRLSSKENSPLLAQEFLKEHGIVLIIEPHFQKTYLDGAAILLDKEKPIIGLTLRYDRLDNFWFTLLHELAHVSKHLDCGISLFFDEIEGIKAIDIDEKEEEADAMAEEAILPKAKWEISPARLTPSPMAANSLANELGVHIAVVAGQIRHRGNKYVYLNKIVNRETVRDYFPNEKWSR